MTNSKKIFLPPPALDYTSESDTRTILSETSSLRRDQYHNQRLQHVPEMKVQLLDTTYLANQRFVEEETENIVNKKLTTNYFKKVPPLPPASIPDNDCWSHSEFTDIVEQKEVTVSRPSYAIKTQNERLIDFEKDMSIEEKIIKNKNITLPTPTPKYQVKNINDTFVTNIKETATSCEKLCDYVANNQAWQNKHGQKSDLNYSMSRTSSLKYEVLKNLFEQPLPYSVSPPKAGFSYLTKDEKTRWFNLITTDETFRTLMIESSTFEEYIQVSKDLRYDHYFSPRTWETIINTLSDREIIARWSAREKLMEQQFESSQYFYQSGGGGGHVSGSSNLVSIPMLSSSTRQEEFKSVTETQVDDHYYKRTLRK